MCSHGTSPYCCRGAAILLLAGTRFSGVTFNTRFYALQPGQPTLTIACLYRVTSGHPHQSQEARRGNAPLRTRSAASGMMVLGPTGRQALVQGARGNGDQGHKTHPALAGREHLSRMAIPADLPLLPGFGQRCVGRVRLPTSHLPQYAPTKLAGQFVIRSTNSCRMARLTPPLMVWGSSPGPHVPARVAVS
jgi:hypothetical protein